jgi:hypothetical protein
MCTLLLGFTKSIEKIKTAEEQAFEYAIQYLEKLVSKIILSDESIATYTQGMGSHVFYSTDGEQLDFNYDIDRLGVEEALEDYSEATQKLIIEFVEFMGKYNNLISNDVPEMHFDGYPMKIKRRPDIRTETETFNDW